MAFNTAKLTYIDATGMWGTDRSGKLYFMSASWAEMYHDAEIGCDEHTVEMIDGFYRIVTTEGGERYVF